MPGKYNENFSINRNKAKYQDNKMYYIVVKVQCQNLGYYNSFYNYSWNSICIYSDSIEYNIHQVTISILVALTTLDSIVAIIFVHFLLNLPPVTLQ